jgi:NADPH-dependent curcumin reductase CurA
MSSGLNREIHLAARPQGWPTLDTFALVETPIPEPTEGQVLVRNIFMSVDPYMRGRMNAARSYAPPYAVGQVLYGGAVGQVVASHTPAFAVGDIVLSNNGWREFFVSDGHGLGRIAPAAPLSYYLGVLGMPGLTAYVGLLDIGQPKAGETVFVSAASGAVGSVVGQLARIKGCRAIGSAGSDEKVRYLLDELGFDAAFNYKETPPEQALR